MAIPPPSASSTALVTGASAGIGEPPGPVPTGLARVIVPGGPLVRAAFAANRYAPRGLALALSKRLMAR